MKTSVSFFSFHPIVIGLFVGTAMSRLATSMTVPFLAIYLLKHGNMSPSAIGYTVGAASIAGMAFGFIGGNISDRLGRQRVMIGSLFLWSAVFAGFYINTVPWMFVVLSVLNGLCKSCFEPVSAAMIGDLTPEKDRYRAYSVRYTAANIGFAIGPLIGAAAGIIGGGTTFLITGCFYFGYGATFVFLWKKFGRHAAGGVPPVRSSVEGFREALGCLARDRALLWFLLGGVWMQFVYAQVSTLSPYVTEHFSKGAELYSVLLATNAVTVVLCQLPLSLWMEKRPPLFSVRLGCALYAAGGLGFALADSAVGMACAMVVFSVGEVLCFPAGNVLTDRIAPPHLRGAYFGAQNLRDLGRFAGSALGFPILFYLGVIPLFAVAGICCLLSVACFEAGERRHRSNAVGTQSESC